MDIFDKREKVLDLQQEMLLGERESDHSFLSLVKFENWCCNSGLSGFVQDINESELQVIDDFGAEHNFVTINKMVLVVHGFLEQYGKGFIDRLNEEEYELLSQYDDKFYAILDQYTDAVYMKYVYGNKQKNP